MRAAYLRKMKIYREEGRNIIYLDETWIDTSYTNKKVWQSDDVPGIYMPYNKGQRLIVIHAGGEMGFVPGAQEIFNPGLASDDYHGQMDGSNFEKWYNKKLLPNLPSNSIIVMDNASYHSVQTDRAPTTATRKADIQDDTEQELQSLFQKQKVTVERAMSKSAKAAFKAHAEFLQRLPVYEFEGYKESFRFFDRSGKGYITADDFRRALTQIQCGRPPSEEQVADLMKEYDLSGDGKVTFEELVVITVKRREDFDVSKRSQMKAMFHQFDKNKNEELEREELAALVQAMGRNLYGTNENTILENFDDNKDGKLQYNEFENFLNNEDRPTSVLSQPQKEKQPEPSTSDPN